jgi:hypothetical protein
MMSGPGPLLATASRAPYPKRQAARGNGLSPSATPATDIGSTSGTTATDTRAAPQARTTLRSHEMPRGWAGIVKPENVRGALSATGRIAVPRDSPPVDSSRCRWTSATRDRCRDQASLSTHPARSLSTHPRLRRSALRCWLVHTTGQSLCLHAPSLCPGSTHRGES